MEIREPKMALATSSGMAFGGYCAGIHCGRTYAFLIPSHAAMFGVAAAVSFFVLHKGLQWYYGDSYDQIPYPLKLVTTLSVATLVTGAIANEFFGVPLMISAAMKIMFCSLVAGLTAAFICKSAMNPQESMHRRSSVNEDHPLG